MDAIQEAEQYYALHPDPWYQAKQKASCLAMMQEMLDELRKPLPPLPPLPPVQVQSFESWCQQHCTPPAPQEAQKEVEQVKKIALHQATVEEDTEITVEKKTEQQHGSTKPDSKSTLSSMPCLCTIRSSGDSAACLSMAYSAYAAFLAWHGLLPGYIEYSEGMEATG